MIYEVQLILHVQLGAAKLVLTKCVFEAKSKTTTDEAIENSFVKQVVYDFEFIEDYSVPDQTTKSTGQDHQLISVLTSQQCRNSTNDALEFLIDDKEDEDDLHTKEDVPSQPLWNSQSYYPLYHTLALMVCVYTCV